MLHKKHYLPWFHKNPAKMNLGMKINIQHLFKIVLFGKKHNPKPKRVSINY